jgi:hypothetical protein
MCALKEHHAAFIAKTPQRLGFFCIRTTIIRPGVGQDKVVTFGYMTSVAVLGIRTHPSFGRIISRIKPQGATIEAKFPVLLGVIGHIGFLQEMLMR